ncbi:bifunctional PIG-L family deacetylase/class I SAM-dependent methyltransferase [Leifsonia sp. ZF2019]|uniref:bifunctional PIG-L family deacetylase/class I SAM-dependent methyltransferase n=1 Tax=Leifsonia sp. ZF2019 TaxID=2781978 RepID=UPI001CBE3F3D|nr:bifunctional PIG-L family deacetylase/class I SAM-dependent methyltransferase [Leifsonia sp. ZF2019]UAJ79296.1 bifunctional PIG-L family deacetylase/class I SAM-dependent methyltransferase [Leifsonia sp. ZF2019]
MVTFDPLVTETSLAEWEAAERWADVPVADATWLAGFDAVTVLAAHPDDETLGVGGLLALCAGMGLPVDVVVATVDSPGRADELSTALERLGLDAAPASLGRGDGRLKHESDDLRRGLEAAIPGDGGARRLVLAPWPGDRHGDHRTLGREAAAVCGMRGHTLRFYPIWLWQWGTPDDLPWGRVSQVASTPEARRRKRAALAAFTSQLHSPHNPSGVLSAEFVERAAEGREVLIEPQRDPAREHFERLHRDSADPWSVRTRWYERRKRAMTVAALPSERYGRALEIGCSNGELSAALAERCDALVGVDAAASAVTLAAERAAALPNVRVHRMRVPDEWPSGDFDLVVVSEVAYYLAADQWEATVQRIVRSLRPGGHLLLCHWTGWADDFAQSGRQAHEHVATRSGLERIVEHVENDFRLEVFA